MRIKTSDFSLQAIAASGQVFTWQELPSGRSDARFLIASGRHRCIASQKGSILTILTPSGAQPSPAVHAHWRHYFALDQDYGAILSKLPLTSEQLKVSSGIRVLAQDWWDASVSFMISQNSNIPRIQHAVTSFMDCGHGLMPRPKQLKALLDNEEYVQGLKLGYRLPLPQGPRPEGMPLAAETSPGPCDAASRRDGRARGDLRHRAQGRKLHLPLRPGIPRRSPRYLDQEGRAHLRYRMGPHLWGNPAAVHLCLDAGDCLRAVAAPGRTDWRFLV